MRNKVPPGSSSPRPHVQVNNYGRINSPGDDIRVALAKNASKAGSPTAASGASCDGDDGEEANGDDAEEDWPENGHDDSASGDELGPANIKEDEWWNRPVGSDDEVEEWRAGDSDNDGGENANGDNAEAAADAQEAAMDANEEAEDGAAAVADADAVAESDTVAADAVLFDGESGDDDPCSLGTDDDVPLLKRRLRHRLQSKSKRARVVLSDDDSPGEERCPKLTAAEKGKAKVAEAPAKAPARRRTSNKKQTSDGDPGSSKGAAKKKAKKAPNPDDIVVNETLGSDDEYAAAAGPIPTFPEKVTPKDPTLHNPNTRPPSPRSKDTTRKRRTLYRYICLQRANGVAISVKDTQKLSREWMKKHHAGKNWNASSHWSQRFRDRWNLVMRVKTKVGQRLSAECAKDCESFWKFVRINRARHKIDLARIINADQTPLFVEMPAERTIEHRGARSVLIRTAGYQKTRLTVMLACTASGEKLRPWVWFKMKNVPNCEIPEGIVVQAQDNGWMDESAVQTWLSKEVLPHLNPQRGQNARRAMLVLDSYRGHITQTMLQSYRTHSITPAVIPAGCTSQIQPLDVSINRCFKAAVRARYARWFMREGIHLKTNKGAARTPVASARRLPPPAHHAQHCSRRAPLTAALAAAGTASCQHESAGSSPYSYAPRMLAAYPTSIFTVASPTSTLASSSPGRADFKSPSAPQALLGGIVHDAAGSAPSSSAFSSPSATASLSSFDPNNICSQAGAYADTRAGEGSDLAELGFSHVNISGDGWDGPATPFQHACFQIQAFDVEGGRFDRGCRQRAFLVVRMRRVASSDGDSASDEAVAEEVQAPRVQYRPESSSHQVCYTVQRGGVYEVVVALPWTNAFLLRQAVNPKLASSFFRSKVVAQRNITVAAATALHALKNGTDSTQMSEQSLPRCTFSLLRESRHAGFWRGDTWHPTACRLPAPITPARIGRCLHGKSVLILGLASCPHSRSRLLPSF
ncbi:unnamed protein product [Closterium sp. NIES-53]